MIRHFLLSINPSSDLIGERQRSGDGFRRPALENRIVRTYNNIKVPLVKKRRLIMGNRIFTCMHCGARNRVPENKNTKDAKCGKCHRPLGEVPESKPVDVVDATFNREVLEHPGVVLVDFWAPWCGPCRMVGPVIDELSAKYAGKVRFAKMNVDENRLVPSKYSIQSIPALMIFRNGELVKSLIGARPKDEIEALLKNLAA
jgi:thioredoxin